MIMLAGQASTPRMLGLAGVGRRTIERRLRAAGRAAEPRPDQLMVVVDWREGLAPSTRHALTMIAPIVEPQVVIAINKLDLAGFEYDVFKDARHRLYQQLADLPLHSIRIVPVSAKHGDMLVARGTSIDWYYGPTLAEIIAPRYADLSALAA